MIERNHALFLTVDIVFSKPLSCPLNSYITYQVDMFIHHPTAFVKRENQYYGDFLKLTRKAIRGITKTGNKR